MRSLDDVRRALAAHRPRVLVTARRAAVAIVLRDAGAASDAEVLLIERARRPGDPWSGHMAFPGGRADPGDADARATAAREAREEVGIELAGTEALGRLDDLQTGLPLLAPLVLSAFVFALDRPQALALGDEVQAALWVPLGALRDPARHVAYRWWGLPFPGIALGDAPGRVVWGLTYQLLQRFFGLGGVALPARRWW